MKSYIILNILLAVNSLGGVWSKTAAGKRFLSFEKYIDI